MWEKAIDEWKLKMGRTMVVFESIVDAVDNMTEEEWKIKRGEVVQLVAVYFPNFDDGELRSFMAVAEEQDMSGVAMLEDLKGALAIMDGIDVSVRDITDKDVLVEHLKEINIHINNMLEEF
jgi:hypothetical protein